MAQSALRERGDVPVPRTRSYCLSLFIQATGRISSYASVSWAVFFFFSRFFLGSAPTRPRRRIVRGRARMSYRPHIFLFVF